MGKFVIRKTDVDYRLALKAANGEIITASEKYTTKAACKKTVSRASRRTPPTPRPSNSGATRLHDTHRKKAPASALFHYENNLASGFFLHTFPQIAAPEAILRIRREMCRNGPR